jgi:hypothetical protein
MKTEKVRWLWFGLCLVFSGLMLACGWLVPAHLRAVEVPVLQRAGEGSASVVDKGLALANANNADAARLLLQAAQAEQIPGTERLAAALAAHAGTDLLFPRGPAADSIPVTSLVIRSETRESSLAYLETTGSPAVRELLRARALTNTVVFSPSSSASGQAIDSAISICGLLLAGNHLSPGLGDAILERSASAATHADARPFEEMLMDVMSLGQRLSWGQLVAFVSRINDPPTLALLAGQMRNAGPQLPELFAAVVVSGKPDRVATYLNDFNQTGLNDLSASLREGEGGVDEFLRRHERLYVVSPRQTWLTAGPVAWFVRVTTYCALHAPWSALMLKWFFYLAGGFLLAVAGHFALPAPAQIEEPLRVRGFHVIRECMFAVGFLLVVVLLSEPFLAQESQKAAPVFRLRLPQVGSVAGGATALIKTGLMDTRSLITLAFFFVLQGLIYSACLAKLAEIRRQKVPPRVQLKLLENEEHLFDGGLYLGFAGTIVCLILVSLGVIQQSLLAAYSSTSFGIIFVVIFKIFNLRPVRRRLLLQAEDLAVAPVQPAATNASMAAIP